MTVIRPVGGLALPEPQRGARGHDLPEQRVSVLSIAHGLASQNVLDHDAAKIAGLYAAGEMVGGIFYFNYPSGAGLVSGASPARRPWVAATGLPGTSNRWPLLDEDGGNRYERSALVTSLEHVDLVKLRSPLIS